MPGKRIRELRNEKGLTLKELGNFLNLGESTMSMYENGKRNPDYNTLIKLADFFGVTIDFLLGRTDARTAPDKISHALEDDPELSAFWDELSKRKDLQLLFKQTRDLSPKDIKQIIRIIKAIEDEESKEH